MDITSAVVIALFGSGITFFGGIISLRYKIDEKRDMILGVHKEHQDLEKRFNKYILRKDIAEYQASVVILMGSHSLGWIVCGIYFLIPSVQFNPMLAVIVLLMVLATMVGCIYTALSARHDYTVWEECVESGNWRGDAPTYQAVLGKLRALTY
jgi:hypothetical protein